MAKTSISKKKVLLTLVIVFGFAAFFIFIAFRSTTTVNKTSNIDNKSDEASKFSEGKITQATITAGPFDLHRRYKSMEGPYIQCDFKVSDLVFSKQLVLPENMVIFTENNGPAASMTAASGNSKLIHGLVNTDSEPRSLLWLKGVKLEVLDEQGKVLPTAEFICHWNLDVIPSFRGQIFSQTEWPTNARLLTISQGQREIYFPDGFGVPVASDEVWHTMFQVANRTTDKHRRLKQRCTMYFIKDSDLVNPLTALAWYTPFVYVVTDRNSAKVSLDEKSNCPSCLGVMSGVNAPNNKTMPVFTDDRGRIGTGHWVVPPGEHVYTTPIRQWMIPDFSFSASPRLIHAVWSHIHPFCKSLALYKCEQNSRQQIFSNAVKTKTVPGVEIESIEYLSSKEGILLEAGKFYELEATYDNTSAAPQDSMAVAGIFCADPTFVRPKWALPSTSGVNCGIQPAQPAK